MEGTIALFHAPVNAAAQGGPNRGLHVRQFILQPDPVHGGRVVAAALGERPLLRPRLTPVALVPRIVPLVFGRQKEIEAAASAVESGRSVEVSGPAGLGKTMLLHCLAHHPCAAAFADGVVCLSALDKGLDDLLQALFDAFYQSDVPFKPTDVQIRQALQGVRALVLLDDADSPGNCLKALMAAAPRCVFVLAPVQPHLGFDLVPVTLRGLPLDDAMQLLEREMGGFIAEQRSHGRALCQAVQEYPLDIIQAAHMILERRHTSAMASSNHDELRQRLLQSRSPDERKVLEALAALGRQSISGELLAGMVRVLNLPNVLETLRRGGLVQSRDARFSLAGDLGDTLTQQWDLTATQRWTLAYLATWAEQSQLPSGELLQEMGTILRMLDWGLGRATGTRSCAWEEPWKARSSWASSGARGTNCCTRWRPMSGTRLPLDGPCTNGAPGPSAWSSSPRRIAGSSRLSNCARHLTPLSCP